MVMAVDAATPASTSGTTTTTTSASFTPPANSLVLVGAVGDGTTSVVQSYTVTDSGSHTWTLLKRSNDATNSAGSGELWACYFTTSPGAITVSAAAGDTGHPNKLLAPVVISGGPAVTQPGATNAVANSSAVAISVTTTAVNSWAWYTLVDWSKNETFTLGTGYTQQAIDGDSVRGNTYAMFRKTTTDASSGTVDNFTVTAASVNTTGAFSHNSSASEILAAVASSYLGKAAGVRQAVNRSVSF